MNGELLRSEQGFPASPGLLAGGYVGWRGIRGFACSHEAVACALVDYRIIDFTRGFHRRYGVWNRGVDSGVIACVETVNGGFDAGNVVLGRRRTIEYEGRGEIG